MGPAERTGKQGKRDSPNMTAYIVREERVGGGEVTDDWCSVVLGGRKCGLFGHQVSTRPTAMHTLYSGNSTCKEGFFFAEKTKINGEPKKERTSMFRNDASTVMKAVRTPLPDLTL